jgi:hypothetical protein
MAAILLTPPASEPLSLQDAKLFLRVVSPVNPLKTLEAVRVFDADGEAQAIAPADFALDTASMPGVIDVSRANSPPP